MAQFNLADYEDVHSRIKKFHQKYPTGRIICEPHEVNDKIATFKATIYKDSKPDTPVWVTGWASELRVTTMSRSSSGKEFEAVNYSSWVENAETSAIGRALANAGFATSKRQSQEEMDKVNRMQDRAKAHKAELEKKRGEHQQKPDPGLKRKVESEKAEQAKVDELKGTSITEQTLSQLFGILHEKGIDQKERATNVLCNLATVSELSDLSEWDGQVMAQQVSKLEHAQLDLLTGTPIAV